MTNDTPHPKTPEEIVEEFNKRFVTYAYAENKEDGLLWSIVENGRYVTPEHIREFLRSALSSQRQSFIEKVENWAYQYENYPEMMGTKKQYERGLSARELKESLLSSLEKEDTTS